MLIYLQMIETDDDRRRFEQLYLKYRGLMFHVSYRVLNNKEDAEDAVHQAFLSIINNMDKVDGIDNPKTRSFCIICAKNKALDLYRSKQRRGEVELIDNLIDIPAPEYENRLDAAIASLPVSLASVVLLHYDNGYSVEEISNILGITVAAARKRLTRAKFELRKILQEEGLIK